MSFEERSNLANKMDEAVTKFLNSIGFDVQNMGYETYFPKALREKLRGKYDDPTISLTRFLPDKFIYIKKGTIDKAYWLEFKICNTPIKYDGRIEKLKTLSGDETISKNNIGAIETSAIETYLNYASIGLRIILLVYSTFHTKDGDKRPLVISNISDVKIVHKDDVTIGAGNASKTPYTNVNLDHFKQFDKFLIETFEFKPNEIREAYQNLLDSLNKT